MSLINVTAAIDASALPLSVTPVFSVMEAWAIMFPAIVVFAPRVAELPTAQKTFWGRAPFCSLTCPAAVVSVEEIWKIQTAVESP